MTNSSSSTKHGQDQPDLSGPTPKSQRTKMGKSEDNDKKVTLFVSIQKILIKPQNNDFPQTLRFWECVKIAACFRY